MNPSQKQAIEQEAKDKYKLIGFPYADQNAGYNEGKIREQQAFIEGATFGLSLQTNEWISVTPEIMPTKEVLAYNGCNYLLGHLKLSNFDKEIICESEHENMYGVTHYQLLTPQNK